MNYMPILVACIGAIGGLLAYVQSRRLAREAAMAKAMQVDADAYKRAQSIYESGIRDLETQIKRLRADLVDEREENLKLRERVNQLETKLIALGEDMK